VPEVLVVAPMELVKIRIQLEKGAQEGIGEFRRTWLACKHLAHQEGVRGFTRGFGITIGREIPFMGVIFTSLFYSVCIVLMIFSLNFGRIIYFVSLLALYFGVYEGLKNYFTVKNHISEFGQIMSGGLAGAVAWGM
jgi:hypothetical protein